ncbi:GPW/gp25 family protein [Nocardioides sp. CPCC 205120]|uniref:GPW/gp25 family protein n=1 Tax=Nocardioides sp. CPCC 205120 TaxID=3406462 RepID=UPI003B511CC6
MAQHLALPLQLRGSRLAALQQDSALEVSQSVALLVSTRPGERRSVPEYGVSDPIFGGLDAGEVTDAVLEWEERVDPVHVDDVATAIVQTGRVWIEQILPSDVVWPAAAGEVA